MAIKNSMTKSYAQNIEHIKCALRDPRFSRLLEASFLEEAITPEWVEFRYVRKTDASRYGRNYFVQVRPDAAGMTAVTAVIQSRKVTVLIDPKWKQEADRVYSCLDVLLELVTKSTV